uniref:Sperm associated antigen 6 n=1 Tax=Gouania willdenowi TaxID=441366 RepID=A0A8C5GC82_GOUWI
MSQRQFIEAFDHYQRSKLHFVQIVADMSIKPRNIKILQEAGVISQLRPLVYEMVPSIQHNVVLALGRLADHNEELAMIVVQEDILPQLVQSIPSQKRSYKKAAVFVLQAVAKYSPELSQAVVDCGGLNALVHCLEDFDPGVKEAAGSALGIIAQHNAMLSQAVVDAGAVPLLVFSLQEPEMAVKRIAASTLSEIAKHTPELAHVVVDTGILAHLPQMICSSNAKQKRPVLSVLSQISKHSAELAEMVIIADIFPAVLVCLQDPDDYVKKNAVTLLKEVVKHSADLSQVIVNCGSVPEVVDYLCKSHGHMQLPGIMLLGYVGGHSKNLAMDVIRAKGLQQLAICLSEDNEQHIKAATVWSIGQIGHHTPEHANAVATAGLLLKVLQLYMQVSSSEDLRIKSKKTLKNILLKCTHLPSLEPLLYNTPSKILKYVLGQFSKMLPHDNKARQTFVTSGGLRKVQEMDAEPGSALQEQINAINSCFPEEIVQYYSPGYSEILLERLENYKPSKVDPSTEETQDQPDRQHPMVAQAQEDPSHTPRAKPPHQLLQRPQAEKRRSPPSKHLHPNTQQVAPVASPSTGTQKHKAP